MSFACPVFGSDYQEQRKEKARRREIRNIKGNLKHQARRLNRKKSLDAFQECLSADLLTGRDSQAENIGSNTSGALNLSHRRRLLRRLRTKEIDQVLGDRLRADSLGSLESIQLGNVITA
jgi:hypothetical protein